MLPRWGMWTRTTAQGYWQPLTGTGELGAVNSDRNRERREVTVVMARKGDDWGETWAATGTMPSCSGCIAFVPASAVRARPPFCGLSALGVGRVGCCALVVAGCRSESRWLVGAWPCAALRARGVGCVSEFCGLGRRSDPATETMLDDEWGRDKPVSGAGQARSRLAASGCVPRG